VTLLSGCLYVQYRRDYDVAPVLSAEQCDAVAGEIERYFSGKGYVLRQKYREYYPEDMHVSVLENPHPTGRKARESYLGVIVKKSGVVQLEHTEVYFHGAPFSGDQGKPLDVIADAREELAERIKGQVGVSVDLRLMKEDHRYHDPLIR
jgi:hypothetical protein